MRKITIKDVAEKSGTSIRTVSRVINNHPNVKRETREKVQAVIDELGFKVNLVARSLKEQKTNQIVVFIDQRSGKYWGAYHHEIFHELHRLAKNSGYRMVISASSPESFEEDDNDGFHLVKHGLCDAAVIFDSTVDDKRVTYLKQSGIPFVLIGKSHRDYDVSYVDVNNFYIGYSGARHLFSKGYKAFSLFLGNEKSIINQERAKGFRAFCQEQQLSNDVYFGLTDFQAVYEKTLAAMQEQEIDAVFISGDERALAVYRAAMERGLSIGREFGVLGIDNLQMSEYMYPPLTSIAPPKREIAEAVLRLLIEQMTDKAYVAQQIVITPYLVERQSL